MPAKIINLNQARKQRQKADKEKTAAANREKFGRNKGEKKRDKLAADKNVVHLDGHKIDNDTEQ